MHPTRPILTDVRVTMSASSNTAVQSAAPERSHAQRLDALEQANEIRSRRSRIKHDLKAGRCLIYPLLLDPPAELQTAKILDLLLAMPKYGQVKANKAVTQCRISPSKTLGGLTDRQRIELARHLVIDLSCLMSTVSSPLERVPSRARRRAGIAGTRGRDRDPPRGTFKRLATLS